MAYIDMGALDSWRTFQLNRDVTFAEGVDGVTAVAAVAAVLVAVWIALRSLREQRRLAHQQFLWDARSALYSQVLTYLRTRSAEAESLGRKIDAHQDQADMADQDRHFAELGRALDDLRKERGLPPRKALDPGSEDEPVARMEIADIFSNFIELFQLPSTLQTNMELLASKNATSALAEYTGSVAMPHLVRNDVDAWSQALDMSMSALDRLTEKLASELKLSDP